MAPLRVEVVYALASGEDAVRVEVSPGATLRDAIVISGICARHPEIDLARAKVGVFGRARPLDAAASHGDRIEIYRPLAVDPKAARRARAASRRTSR